MQTHSCAKLYLPLLGHLAFLSMESHSRAKNPATQVPLHAPSAFVSLGALLVDVVPAVVVVFLVVVVVVVVVVEVVVVTGGGSGSLPGMTSSAGYLPLKISLATQHLRPDLHRPSMFRIVSQYSDRRSATHTPGHFSVKPQQQS